ncbi:MAG: single-stranded DNA-binding protein, partial [Persicimonas sp.]
VEGSIEVDEYTDGDGIERKSFEIKAYKVQFLSGESGGGGDRGGRRKKKKKKKRRPGGGGGGFGATRKTKIFDSDDIPF